MPRIISGEVDNKPKKLIGELYVSGQQGPVGPPGPKGDKGDKGDPGPAGGVNSFNTRQGEVIPTNDDYTAYMVGAVAESDKITNAEILSLFN